MSNLVDSHCHIHRHDFPIDTMEILKNASENHVTKIICVGTNLESSRETIKFAQEFSGQNGVDIFATLGTHPHEATSFTNNDDLEIRKLIKEHSTTVKGVGEIGLDYYYEFSPRAVQISAFEKQLQIALDHNLPVSFHLRDDAKNPGRVFEDFWPIVSNFPKVSGVMHSFTDVRANMEIAINHGFYIGVNGIVTFNKNPDQAEMYRSIPIERMLLETDSPYLSPVPFRGRTSQPAYVRNIAEFLSDFLSRPIQEIAEKTTENVTGLFQIS